MRNHKWYLSLISSVFLFTAPLYVQAEENSDVISENEPLLEHELTPIVESNPEQDEKQSSDSAKTSVDIINKKSEQRKIETKSTKKPVVTKKAATTKNTKTTKKTTTTKKPAKKPAISTLAEAGVAEVGDVAALTKALADVNITTIKLTKDLDLGKGSFAVIHDVTIDGQGHTITYGQDGGSAGIHYTKDNTTLEYKNINFGYKSELGKNSTTNANNRYGIAPSSGHRNITLILNNVNYYSDYGSQMLYLRGANNQIILRGTNFFEMGGGPKAGSAGDEEFAEASKFFFDENSKTTILDGNLRETGFIWAVNEALDFHVAKNAQVYMESGHDFVYSGYDPKIQIDEGGQMSFIQRDLKTSAARGQIMSQDNRTITLNAAQQSKLKLHFINSSNVGNFNANFGDSAVAYFSVNANAFFNTNSPTAITNNNSKEITFQTKLKPTLATGAIGAKGTFDFINNGPLYDGYRVFGGGEKPIVTQPTAAQWLLNTTTGFSRTPNNFNGDEQSALKTANPLRFVRNKPVNLSFEPQTNFLDKEITVEKYQAEKKKKQLIDLYWQDPTKGDGLVIKAFNSEGKEIGATSQFTTNGSQDFQLEQIEIPTVNLNYGPNKVAFKAYDVLEDGSLIENSAPPLNLTVNIEGALYFESVTSELLWTNLNIRNTIGVISRDEGNDLELNVVDSRQGDTGFKVTANLVNQAPNVPFTFVWKQSASDEIKELKSYPVFFDFEVTPVEQYLYQAKWDNETGVLLKSEDYIKPGEYNNTATIEWLLQDVPKIQ